METFNLQLTGVLGVLLSVPQEGRDDSWCKNFLGSVPNASLASFEPQIQTGPDSFPYFQLAMPDAGAFTPFSVVHILNDCIENGVGAVIHTNTQRDEQPAWVFTLGDLLAYSLFQDFEGEPKVYGDAEQPPDENVDRNLLRAVPSEGYFPTGARAAMGRFMRGPFQHPDPKIGLVSGPSLRPRESLMVNLRASDYGGDMGKLGSAMRYLTWFVPKTYSVMALPDDWRDDWMSPLP
jgi:hypothetical protein